MASNMATYHEAVFPIRSGRLRVDFLIRVAISVTAALHVCQRHQKQMPSPVSECSARACVCVCVCVCVLSARVCVCVCVCVCVHACTN